MKTTNLLIMITAISALVAAPGCDDDDVESAAIEKRGFQFGGGCSGWDCGYNAAEVNGRSLAELNLSGVKNSSGVKYVGLQSPLGLSPGWTLTAEGGELVAVKGGDERRGDALVGFKLLLEMKLLGLLPLTVPVIITEYHEAEPWALGGAPLPAYTLVYADLNNPLVLRGVCNDELLDPLVSTVTVLYGERYDEASKTVLADQDGWLNIACAGSALAKLKMMNYGPQADFDGLGNPATPAQRQATLKMITADYCGTGEPFTENGTPLIWENASGTIEPSPLWTPGEVEAVWTDAGALCLDTPRLGDTVGALPCALPPCAGLSVSDGEWITVNPA